MKTLRKMRALAPRHARRFDFDITDATIEQDPGAAPEAVFDRVTGPWDRRRAFTMPGASDEET
jgi:hypothetical protein